MKRFHTPGATLFGALLISTSLFPASAFASETTATPEQAAPSPAEKAQFSPVGTLLLDGGLFISPDKQEFPDGVAVPDVRLGVAMKYGKWQAKVEAGFAYGKVVLKDMWMQYDFSTTDFLRVGLQMQQFGYQNATAACQKVTMIEPISNTIFNEPHLIGIQWFHSADKYFTTLSAHVEPNASSKVLGRGAEGMSQEGYGFRTRLVARPYHSSGRMLQAGISGAFLTPQYHNGEEGDTHDAFSFRANFPSKVVQVQALSADVRRAMNLWKLTPELMACYGPMALESQYFFMQINRRGGLPAFRAHGAYATLRGLILGGDYQYSMGLAGIANPQKGSLEGVVSYNYTGLSNSRAGIYGGRLNDISVGVNYYFNRYITGKLRYSATHVWDRPGLKAHDFSAVQMRLQLIF
ncbi:MAG: ATPase [Bacteroidales bacterium]|nr:ATPase [Bacteroidales bacterium]